MHSATVHPRRAFTLIELILVLGVVVMIFSLAVPLVTRTLGAHALRQSADVVRVAMGKARVEAIKSGQIQALFFQIESDWFNVAPFAEVVAQEGMAARKQRQAANEAAKDFDENRLPAGIRFASGIAVADGRSADAFNSTGSEAGSQIQPILFYPDGTAQDAKVFMKDKNQNLTAVELRGLTGVARTVPVAQR